MSDLVQDELKKQKRMAEQLSYEKNINALNKETLNENYSTENLLYTESSQSMVLDSDIEALANYSEIKAKQRVAIPQDAESIHTEEYQSGRGFIGLLSAKNSHRSMRKRNNKMAESAKRLNNVGKNARKLKEDAANLPLKKRIESLEGLYDKVRVADRYFAEAIAGNQVEEDRLKEKAEITYVQNCYNIYRREEENSRDQGEKETLRQKMNELSAKLEKMKEAFSQKYTGENVTVHRLEEGEIINRSKKAIKDEAKRRKEEAEALLKTYENEYNENTIDKNANRPWPATYSDDVNAYLYTKSKYSDTTDQEATWRMSLMEKTVQTLVSNGYQEEFYYEKYREEKKAIFKKYKALSPQEREIILKATPAYKHYATHVISSVTSSYKNKLRIEEEINFVKTRFEEKNNLISSEYKVGFKQLRDIESLERQVDILNEYLQVFAKDHYVDIDLATPKRLVLEEIKNTEKKLGDARKELINTYIEDTKRSDGDNATVNEAIAFYKNNIKIKSKNQDTEKSLQDFDLAEEMIKTTEIINRTHEAIPNGETVNPVAIKLNAWHNASYESLYDHYMPKGSELLKKLEHNILMGKKGAIPTIDRNITKSLRPVKFDSKGKVLEEYKKNDEFNRKFIESHVNTTLTEDTANDEKVFEERLPYLMSIMDEIQSFEMDEKLFSVDYISESFDNFVKYQHIADTVLSFHGNVLKDRINERLKEYCNSNPELKKKWEEVDKKQDVIIRRNNILLNELMHKVGIDGNRIIIKKTTKEAYDGLTVGYKSEFEDALKAYNDLLKKNNP